MSIEYALRLARIKLASMIDDLEADEEFKPGVPLDVLQSHVEQLHSEIDSLRTAFDASKA